ncbi:MAG: TIGR03936 family radical SAM-associated protein [Clostridia bacterium]|nr:TIGR03936 family radical SAM-associated protein [Clostridia bacterium]
MQDSNMHRYLFGFYKRGNMRFISHLDLQRVFKRCIKRAGVVPAYSKGFNPHEKINIVHPLPLGFETERDYFEMDTETPYETDALLEGMNKALPEGLCFTFCEEIPHSSKNSSSIVSRSEYEAFLPSSQNLNTDAFIIQDEVIILKKDKKTKKQVEKNVKDWVYRLELLEESEVGTRLFLQLRSASNETLNPANLIASLCAFSGAAFDREALRVVRTDILAEGESGPVPLSAYYKR